MEMWHGFAIVGRFYVRDCRDWWGFLDEEQRAEIEILVVLWSYYKISGTLN